MKPSTRHQFILEILDADGAAALAQRRLDAIDWEPAREAAVFSALRRGILAAGAAAFACAIEPRWDAEAGKPYIDGVKARLPGIDAEETCPMNLYFALEAKRFASDLVEAGRLQKGDVYHYRVAAYPAAPASTDRVGWRAAEDDAAVEAIAVAPPIREDVSLEEASESATVLMDAAHAGPADMPLFLPQRVIDEAVARAAGVIGVETGGILLGNLHRSRASNDLGLVVTALIPATQAREGSTTLTFTPETWAAVDGVLRLRGGKEAMVGWFHSHPARSWCGAECPLENRLKCAMQRSFFSPEDKLLHRAIFPRAWSVGLLVTDADAGMKPSLWAWRAGAVQRRGCIILGGEQKTRTAREAALIESRQ